MHGQRLERLLIANSLDDPAFVHASVQQQGEKAGPKRARWGSLVNVFGREVGGDVVLELCVEQGFSLGTTTLVSHRVVNVHLFAQHPRISKRGIRAAPKYEQERKPTSSMTVPSLRVMVRALPMKRFSGSWYSVEKVLSSSQAICEQAGKYARSAPSPERNFRAVAARPHLCAELVNAGVRSDGIRVVLRREATEDDCTQLAKSAAARQSRPCTLENSRGTAIMY